MLLSLALIVIGFALLIFGANFLVGGACTIARRFGMPDRVAGLTIVAIGTSLPELIVSITSAVAGHADMAFGNVAGSCLANLLLILGLSATISSVKLSRSTQRFEIPACVLATGLLALFANTDGAITPVEGAVLLAAFIAFVARTAVIGLSEGAGEQDQGKGHASSTAAEGRPSGGDAAEGHAAPGDGAGGDILSGLPALRGSVAWAVWLVVVGAAMLKVGADLVVDNATLVASAAGVSERVIGITVVALGTCLPELVTSVVAALRGNSDIAVGNVVGSNISNLLLVMGGPALFSTIPFDPAYNVDLALLAVFSLVLVGFTFMGRRHEMSRANGVVFVVLYAAYIATSLLR